MFSTSSVVKRHGDLILRAGAAAQLVLLFLPLAAEADAVDGAATARHLLEAGEGAGGDERDVAGRHDDVVAVGRVRQLERHHDLARLEHLEQLALHAHAGDVLGRAGAGEDGVVLPAGDLVELVEADDADRRQQRIVVGGVQQARDDRVRILPDVAGLGVGRDVDDHRRQPAGCSGTSSSTRCVLPQPVGPMSRKFDFGSTCSRLAPSR